MTQVIRYNGTEFRAFNKSYAVSKNGQVLKLRGLQIIEPHGHNNGYLQISHSGLVHRMVAACWLEKPKGANHVHHINRDKTDNRASNLEWVTPKTHLAERHAGEFGHYERTEITREKLRKYRLGRKHDPETIEKIRSASIALGCLRPRAGRPKHQTMRQPLRHARIARCQSAQEARKSRKLLWA